MTDVTYVIKDTTQDLGFLLSLTKIVEMDEDGFWYDTSEKKRFVYKLDSNDTGKEIVVFQDPLPKGDYYFFNPFAEGFGKKSPAVQLFYKTIRVAFNYNLMTQLMYVADAILASKKDESISLSHVLVRMSSVMVDKKSTLVDVIDEKMVDEFKKLHERIEADKDADIIFVPYLHQQMTAKVKCDALTDPKWDEKYGNDIRKKSLAAFKALLMGVLGIKDPSGLEDFTVKYDPDLKSSARLHTTLSVYLKLYSRFNDGLADAYAVDGVPSERDEVDLGQLQEVIDRLPLAYAIAKHMVQPSLPKHKPTDTAPADTSKLSFGSGGARRFTGPEVVDEFGRKTGTPHSLSFMSSAIDHRRFKPQVISEGPMDPFAPAIGTTQSPIMGSVGYNQFTAPPSGGYFGGGGLNVNAPSNFGSPMTQRRYF